MEPDPLINETLQPMVDRALMEQEASHSGGVACPGRKGQQWNEQRAMA